MSWGLIITDFRDNNFTEPNVTAKLHEHDITDAGAIIVNLPELDEIVSSHHKVRTGKGYLEELLVLGANWSELWIVWVGKVEVGLGVELSLWVVTAPGSDLGIADGPEVVEHGPDLSEQVAFGQQVRTRGLDCRRQGDPGQPRQISHSSGGLSAEPEGKKRVTDDSNPQAFLASEDGIEIAVVVKIRATELAVVNQAPVVNRGQSVVLAGFPQGKRGQVE